MLVFLSYPSEFKEVAEALDAELRRRKIDTFYDKKAINPGADWQNEIEANIKEAYVFVVLYSPEAATTSNFYLREIERIEAACEKSLQRLIPVIFNPTKIVDVPAFYQQHQFITSETEGKVKDKRDDYWIAQIAQELERLKAIRDRLKKRQIISRSAQVLGAITIVLLSIGLFNTKTVLTDAETVLTDTRTALTDTEEALIKAEEKLQLLQGKFDGGKLCHSLIGKYTLHQNYVFVETHEKDARSTATSATWNAIECIPNRRNGDVILKGEDETDFDIEAIFDGKYGQIATAKYTYGSEVHIRKDGTLIGRSFDPALNAKTLKKFYKDERGNSFNKPMNFIDKKIEEIIDLRNKKHRNTKTSPCIPMTGETGGKMAISFVCPGYTRTMVKDKEI